MEERTNTKNYLCNFMLWQVRLHVTHNCHEFIYKFLCTIIKGEVHFWIYVCLIQTFGKFSCKNESLIATSFRIHGSFIYLPFLQKTCSSGIELTIKSDCKMLCTSQTFTFQSLPVGSETSSCLGPISLIILRFGMYFAS